MLPTRPVTFRVGLGFIPIILGATLTTKVSAVDWPTWRGNIERTGVVAEGIPSAGVGLSWSHQLGTYSTAFSYDPDMAVDKGPDPIAADGMVFTATPDDEVIAISAVNGSVLWRYQAFGPVRFAPSYDKGKLYVGADDGILRCLDAKTGAEIWRQTVAPGNRTVIAHGRVVSAWPISIGPTISGDQVISAGGVFGSDDLFVAGFDKVTGAVRWRNDDLGARGTFVVQAAGSGQFAWGYPAISQDRIIMPGGGNPPVFLDVATGGMRGRMPITTYNSWRWQVAAAGGWAYCGYLGIAMHDQRTSFRSYVNADKLTLEHPPIIDGEQLWGVNDSILKSAETPSSKLVRPSLKLAGQWWVGGRLHWPWANLPEQGELTLPAGASLPQGFTLRQLFAKAGEQLIAGGPGAVVVMRVGATIGAAPRVEAVYPLSGNPIRAVVADGRLIVSTDRGELACFAKDHSTVTSIAQTNIDQSPLPVLTKDEQDLLTRLPSEPGHALVIGDHPQAKTWAERLAKERPFTVLAVAGEQGLAWQKSWQGRGASRPWAVVHKPDPSRAPLHSCRVIIAPAGSQMIKDVNVSTLLPLVRPYGGMLWIEHENGQATAWENMVPVGWTVARVGNWTVLTQTGSLPGAGTWSHYLADPANTCNSNDDRAQGPFGMQWFGGAGGDPALYPDGEEIPVPLSMDGRLILQSPDNRLSAVDIYTGAILWTVPLPQSYVIFRGSHNAKMKPENFPDWIAESATYEIPLHYRSRETGLNMAMDVKDIFLCIGHNLRQVDPRTGATRKDLIMPLSKIDNELPCWGDVNVSGDYLVCTAFLPSVAKGVVSRWGSGGGPRPKDRLPMGWLLVMDRRDGSLVWSRKAEAGFLNRGLAIGDGHIFAVDLVIDDMMKGLAEGGLPVPTSQPRLRALNLTSGASRWELPLQSQMRHVAYDKQRNMVLATCRERSRWVNGNWSAESKEGDPVTSAPTKNKKPGPPPGETLALAATNGALIWRNINESINEPYILKSTYLVNRAGLTFDLDTGFRAQRPGLFNDYLETWQTSKYGCNFLVGSPWLVSHQQGAYDETGRGFFGLQGNRGGCTPSRLPVGGLIVVSNLTAGHPDGAMMTAYALAPVNDRAHWLGIKPGNQLSVVSATSAAFNLGAPGDLLENGQTWLAAGPGGRFDKESMASWPWLRLETPEKNLQTYAQHPRRWRGSFAAVASSGIFGEHTYVVGGLRPGNYTLTLIVGEPDTNVVAGQRVFSVRVQGKILEQAVDPMAIAGQIQHAAHVQVPVVIPASGECRISIVAKSGIPLLSGIHFRNHP